MAPYLSDDGVLAMRPLTLEDSRLIVDWRNNPRVRSRYIYREPFTLEGQERYYHEKIETGQAAQFVFCEKETGRPIGCSVLSDLQPGETAEYGNWIGEDDAVGKGYNARIVRLTAAYAFRTLGLQFLTCRIFADNPASIRGCERAGFRIVETLPEVECSDGTRADMFLLRMDAPITISFVIPCYRSAQTLPGVVAEIDAAMSELRQYAYEVVMVNDGSGADTWEAIRSLCQGHADRRGYDLARNFGQHAALMAGIRQAAGDIIVCLDDDGQTPADEVGKLLSALEAGADVVYASYEHKEHSVFRNFGSWANEKMLEWMLDKPKELYVSSYFAMRRYVADEVLRYGNSYPYLVGLVLRTTNNIVNVPVTHRRREVGSSGYTLGKLLALWMNGFTAFSVKPLRAGMGVGVACAVCAVLYGIYTIIKKFVNPDVPVGWSALMVAVVFFGGMILVMLGLVGEYVGRTYITVNSAPQYVIRENTTSRASGPEGENAHAEHTDS